MVALCKTESNPPDAAVDSIPTMSKMKLTSVYDYDGGDGDDETFVVVLAIALVVEIGESNLLNKCLNAQCEKPPV